MIVHPRASYQGTEKSIGWVSLQPDGAISVGLSDRTFISPKLRSRVMFWNAYNRVTLAYRLRHSPHADEPVLNPHLTYHPAMYFHCRANGDEELFAGIADVGITVDQDGEMPWVRFVSNPVSELKDAGRPRASIESEIEVVQVGNVNCSVGLGVDFVNLDRVSDFSHAFSRMLTWEQCNIHIFCDLLAPQTSTLAWYHQY